MATDLEQKPASALGRPKGGSSEKTKASLLLSATREFSQHGLAGARIERIVADAKCNIRMLYHHFGNKDGLYQAVLSEAFSGLRGHEAKIEFDLTDPVGWLDRLLRATFEFFEKNPLFEGILRTENIAEARFMRRLPALSDAAARTRGRIKEIIAAGEASGVLRPGLDAEQLHVTIMALCLFHLSNGATISALLDTDSRDVAWRQVRKEHVAAILRAYVTAS